MKHLLAFVIFLNSIVSAQTETDTISLPAKYHPSKSKFYVHNEIEINASPATVWNILIDALQWESWYKSAKNRNR
ncbi:MAG: hypothetical protein U1C70_03255 [Sediminibacterium sp.]|jgi:hypothetical protein|uniref:hypothetical protein n=1 Tax=Sediminibacterium sp. TaxID=1917865 RepID=UPI002AB973CF|nr:hypothetical protein [Sediminibacterium sp.]MDZ4070821.1 hypothetical protein [Sediminibacterium sp.]